jgi:hypothetical protein
LLRKGAKKVTDPKEFPWNFYRRPEEVENCWDKFSQSIPAGTLFFFWQHSSDDSLHVEDLLVLVLKASKIPEVRVSAVVKIMMNRFFMSSGFVRL